MARFAPVVPTHMARQLQSSTMDYLGRYHLLLAHDILDKPEDYQGIYGQVRRDYPDSFIIMDNSIVELGKAMEIKDLLAAAKVLTPDCIVIPDVMGDYVGTVEKAIEFCRDYYEESGKSGIDDQPLSLMGVLQGETIEQALECLSAFYALPCVDYIGIPRMITKLQGSRMPLLQRMLKAQDGVMKSFKGFHLLGFSDDVLDDVACARMSFIQGIDSAVPVRAGIKRIPINIQDPEWSNKVGSRGDFWNMPCDETWTAALPTIRDNLNTYRRLIVTSN